MVNRFTLEVFEKYDTDEPHGHLNRAELKNAFDDILGEDKIKISHLESLFDAFDNGNDGLIDFCEFTVIGQYISKVTKVPQAGQYSIALNQLSSLLEDASTSDIKTASITSLNFDRNGDKSVRFDQSTNNVSDLGESNNITALIQKAIAKFERDDRKTLQQIAKKLYPMKDMLCVQDSTFDDAIDLDKSHALDYSEFEEESLGTKDSMDPEFNAAFPPSSMRCLALVSHNGMKKTMREFCVANKNLLKKFRLTGTNSTMTMLKEVFKDEEPGTVVFGPACASGPLGGDAELVAHMVSGLIGGIIFFQDPMDSHPHRADIDCLLRQALVYNSLMAVTPTSAILMLEVFRTALMNNRPELIPSFFLTLQSPTVEAYKSKQKKVVNEQRETVKLFYKDADPLRNVVEDEEEQVVEDEQQVVEEKKYDEKVVYEQKNNGDKPQEATTGKKKSKSKMKKMKKQFVAYFTE